MNCLLSDIRVNTFDLFFFLCKLASTAGVEYLRMLFFRPLLRFCTKSTFFFNCLVTFVLWFTNPYPIKLVCAKNRTKSCAAEVLVDVFGG